MLVIAYQKDAVNTFWDFVHTARHELKFCSLNLWDCIHFRSCVYCIVEVWVGDWYEVETRLLYGNVQLEKAFKRKL